jgi:hypothetical protein
MSDNKKDNIFDKIGDFFENIGEWFGRLFRAAEKEWQHLEPDVQEALVTASGVVSIINQNLDKAPGFVFDVIQTKFPTLSKEKLQEGLTELDTQFGTIGSLGDTDLLTTIQNIQVFLSGIKGKVWEGISSNMAQIMAIVLAGDKTPFAKIVMFIEYAYREFVKGGDRPPKPPKVS